MYLSEQAHVSDEVRRIINNGYESNHPFRSGTQELEDYMSIFNEIRELPIDDFNMCLAAIKEVVDKHSDCVGCYGKGLAYLKLITEKINETEHTAVTEKYVNFSTARNRDRDFESELFGE